MLAYVGLNSCKLLRFFTSECPATCIMDSQAIDEHVSEIMTLLGPSTEITTQSMIRAMVAVTSSLMFPKINVLHERLSSLEERTRQLENKFTVIEQQRTQLNALEEECNSLKAVNAQLQENLQKTAKFALATRRYSYQYNLLLHGVSEAHPNLDGAINSRNPSFRKLVLDELQKFDSTITEKDFETAHRLGPSRPPIDEAEVPATSRAILIKFYNRDVRERLLETSIQRYKKLKSAGSTALPSELKRPYLTSHRVRDFMGAITENRNQQEDTEEIPTAETNLRKRRGYQRSPPKSAQQIRQAKLRRKRM